MPLIPALAFNIIKFHLLSIPSLSTNPNPLILLMPKVLAISTDENNKARSLCKDHYMQMNHVSWHWHSNLIATFVSLDVIFPIQVVSVNKGGFLPSRAQTITAARIPKRMNKPEFEKWYYFSSLVPFKPWHN